jgi:uncharacterized damage-inducible protein DinB
MTAPSIPDLLKATLNAWDRSNAALTNLLRGIPTAALGARALGTSPTIAEMATHLHHERMVSVLENVPECAAPLPAAEWTDEHNGDRLIERLNTSAALVRTAVASRTAEQRALDRDFAHPIQLVQFLIFHDAYHHGQMKLALKASGNVLDDEYVGVHVWDVWRAR